MKIARYKKASKTINFYKNNFGFRDPYQFLIDATFCQLALQHKINIQEQLPKYIQAELRLVTTQCIIMEAESLGGAVVGATQIVKKFLVHRCGHDKKPISAANCMKSMIKGNHYIIATQDRDLQEYLRSKPGQPLMYLHQKTPVLEQPSEVSRKYSARKQDETLDFVEKDVKRLDQLKRAAGILINDPAIVRKKKLKQKQPNPLSCKKKKKKTLQTTPLGLSASGGVNKKSRTRTRIAKHIKEVMLNNNN